MRGPVPLAAALAVLALLGPVGADVAPDPEFGQSLAPEGRTTVAMTAEEVSITLAPERALVKAVFHLRNTGGATELTVGFPDVVSPRSWSSNAPPEGVSGIRLRDFKAEVDGRPVRHEHVYLQKKDSPFHREEVERNPKSADDWLWGGWLVWPMEFGAGRERTVVVTYHVPYRPPYRPSLLGDRTFSYILRTGAPWHGPIGRAEIEVRWAEGLTRDHLGGISPAGFEEIEGGLRWVLRDLEPTEDVEIGVRRHPDLAAAAAGYLETAEAEGRAGREEQAVHALACAAVCQERTGQHEACAAACRKIVAYERKVRAERPDRRRPYHVKIWWKDPVQPWECRLVDNLLEAGTEAEARREAAAAAEALRPVAEATRKYDAEAAAEMDARIARYEALAKGE